MGNVIPDQMPDMVVRATPTFGRKVRCLLGDHEWTSRVEMGAKPDPKEVAFNTVPYFFAFAAPICRHCPKQLTPLE